MKNKKTQKNNETGKLLYRREWKVENEKLVVKKANNSNSSSVGCAVFGSIHSRIVY